MAKQPQPGPKSQQLQRQLERGLRTPADIERVSCLTLEAISTGEISASYAQAIASVLRLNAQLLRDHSATGDDTSTDVDALIDQALPMIPTEALRSELDRRRQ